MVDGAYTWYIQQLELLRQCRLTSHLRSYYCWCEYNVVTCQACCELAFYMDLRLFDSLHQEPNMWGAFLWSLPTSLLVNQHTFTSSLPQSMRWANPITAYSFKVGLSALVKREDNSHPAPMFYGFVVCTPTLTGPSHRLGLIISKTCLYTLRVPMLTNSYMSINKLTVHNECYPYKMCYPTTRLLLWLQIISSMVTFPSGDRRHTMWYLQHTLLLLTFAMFVLALPEFVTWIKNYK